MTGIIFYTAAGIVFGAALALVAVWWFQPRRLQGVICATSRLVARQRASRLRPTHPDRARPHRPAHAPPTVAMGDLAATPGA